MIENSRHAISRSDLASGRDLSRVIESRLGGRALRWNIGKVTADEVLVDATLTPQVPDEAADGLVTDRFYSGKSVVVSIVPTGVGCSIGGYAGDAAPATALLASATDFLVTNPNAVNASDFIALDDNVLYTEGYSIDLLCRGRTDLYRPLRNRVGLIVEKSSEHDLDCIFNTLNTVRAVHGVDISEVIVTERPIGSRCLQNRSGAFVGSVDHPQVLLDACQALIARGVDAIGITTKVQDLPSTGYAQHFAGGYPNPVGGAEAVISHLVTQRFHVPAAHAPLMNVKELDLQDRVVDARGAGEFTSVTGLACILIGLRRAPQLRRRPGTPVADAINVNNVIAVVAPASCMGGIPVLSACARGIPVIAVQDNETILEVTPGSLGLTGVLEVGSYAEAAGTILALRRGISLESLRRPLETIRHQRRRPHQAGDRPETGDGRSRAPGRVELEWR
jgi:hypothetical protein